MLINQEETLDLLCCDWSYFFFGPHTKDGYQKHNNKNNTKDVTHKRVFLLELDMLSTDKSGCLCTMSDIGFESFYFDFSDFKHPKKKFKKNGLPLFTSFFLFG